MTAKDEFELAMNCFTYIQGGPALTFDDFLLGKQHLLNAYFLSKSDDFEDKLLKARILMKMNHWIGNTESAYNQYINFIKPAYDIYTTIDDESISEEKEECIRYTSMVQQQIGNDNLDEMIALIDPNHLMDNPTLNLYDGRIVYFKHTKYQATLKYETYGYLVTIRFYGVIGITSDIDPLTAYIDDVNIYRCAYNDDLMEFDIGILEILCKKAIVTNVSKIKEL